jgi:hypothetical protein
VCPLPSVLTDGIISWNFLLALAALNKFYAAKAKNFMYCFCNRLLKQTEMINKK